MTHVRCDRVIAWLVLLGSGALAACGGGHPGGEESRDAEVHAVDAAVDASVGSDAGAVTPVDGGARPECVPFPGTANVPVLCDDMEVAMLARDGAATTAHVRGRLTAETPGGCAIVESVAIYESTPETPLLLQIDTSTAMRLDGDQHAMADAPATTALVERCSEESADVRFDGLGVVVRGRIDGGTFEARCARAARSGHWPPALILSCHRNVDAPARAANASVQVVSFMGMTFRTNMLAASLPHGPGGALTSVDGRVRVLPLRSHFDALPALMPRDSAGWMGSVSDRASTTTESSITLVGTGELLGEDLCPPSGGPGSSYPPIFLARFTGMGQHGPYATEALVRSCITSTATPPAP